MIGAPVSHGQNHSRRSNRSSSARLSSTSVTGGTLPRQGRTHDHGKLAKIHVLHCVFKVGIVLPAFPMATVRLSNIESVRAGVGVEVTTSAAVVVAVELAAVALDALTRAPPKVPPQEWRGRGWRRTKTH